MNMSFILSMLMLLFAGFYFIISDGLERNANIT